MDLENGVDEPVTAELDDDTNESIKFSYRSRQYSYRRSSVEDPLLPQRSLSVSSINKRPLGGGEVQQELYIPSEDTTIVIAGFTTATSGAILYYSLCVLTFGFAFLLFRWLPRWRIWLLGRPSPLTSCQWVVVEV